VKEESEKQWIEKQESIDGRVKKIRKKYEKHRIKSTPGYGEETYESSWRWDLQYSVHNRRLSGVRFQDSHCLAWDKTNTKANGKLPRNLICGEQTWPRGRNSESS
jgi:hypothetical protein